MDFASLFLVFLVLLTVYSFAENFSGTSPGTFIQLKARGIQDLYLTGPPDDYPYYFYNTYAY